MTTSPLTAREDQVRALVVDGLTNDEIAARLAISSRTVEAHLRMLFRKLNVTRRDDLASPSGSASPDDVVGAAATEDEVRRLEEKLAERQRVVESYEAAVERIIDRQFPLFEERVEITVTVGGRSGEDMVVERHWTIPTPYVVYRVIRPITPRGETLGPFTDSVGLMCEVLGQDVGVAVETVADRNGRPLVLIFFQPGLQKPTEWELRYRTPGMWDPLRNYGTDKLVWATGTLQRPRTAGINELTIHFDVPEGWAPVDVAETNGTGSTTEVNGTVARTTWRNPVTTAQRYEWLLRRPEAWG